MADYRDDEYDDMEDMPLEDADYDDFEDIPDLNAAKAPETDSAKYTKAYVKEVVKGLYTSDPADYITNKEKRKTEMVFKPLEEDASNDDEKSFADTKKGFRKVELRTLRDENKPAPPKERNYNEEFGSKYNTQGAHKAEKRNAESVDYGAGRFSPGSGDEFQDDEVSYVTNIARSGEDKEKMPSKKKVAYYDTEDEPYTAETFLKSYEIKNQREARNNEKRRTFGTADTSKESAFDTTSGRKGHSASQNIRAFKAEASADKARKASAGYSSFGKRNQSFDREVQEAEYMSLRDFVEDEGIGEEGYQDLESFLSGATDEHDTIPLVINKNIESKPKKTSEEYRKKPAPAYEQAAGGSSYNQVMGRRGINIFAIAFMVIAVIIIGVLVWKINSMSRSVAETKNNTEELAQFQTQIQNLTDDNEALEAQVEKLTQEARVLQEQNAMLAPPPQQAQEEGGGEEGQTAPQEQPEESAASAQTHTVQSGDTLYAIAEKYLGDGDRYPEIQRLNNMNANTPLLPGKQLKLPQR